MDREPRGAFVRVVSLMKTNWSGRQIGRGKLRSLNLSGHFLRRGASTGLARKQSNSSSLNTKGVEGAAQRVLSLRDRFRNCHFVERLAISRGGFLALPVSLGVFTRSSSF